MSLSDEDRTEIRQMIEAAIDDLSFRCVLAILLTFFGSLTLFIIALVWAFKHILTP